MVTVTEVVKEVGGVPDNYSGERFIRNNKDRPVVAYWTEPGIFAVLIYRSVGRLFARGVSRRPLHRWDAKCIYEVGVEEAASFIRDHGGFIEEKEMQELGFGTEVARCSLSFLYADGAEVKAYREVPALYVFYERDGKLRMCHGGYDGILRSADKHQVEAFARSYIASFSKTPTAAEIDGKRYGEACLRSNDIPEKCKEFVNRIALLSDM
jgi:hypothetical protein